MTEYKVEVYFDFFDEWLVVATFDSKHEVAAIKYRQHLSNTDPLNAYKVFKYTTTTKREGLDRDLT